MRKFIIPTIATLIFIAGLVSMVLPFVPLGWLLIMLASLLMSPYFKFMRKFIGWLAKKDKTGLVEKAGKKASKLYEWAGDDKRADEMDTIIDENSQNSESSKEDK
ncbi:hypothetical protein SYJ56_07140 [Algoriphagus sp. D3-2-R+10]|uniref:hypothetical protein n=1 Tax=Algoriphagus aurantiacus TaxID=3103948 RepID=UPI002B36B847|nr:hypothetical protein [Algoriphagus sp. D3-2-R+10]MEB2775075.1 hypothetical protein [Algoriphagus sp. D3-2-R+10]